MLIPIGFLGAGGASGAYELITTTTLGSSQTSVTFTNSGAWAGYKHLQLRIAARSDGAVNGSWCFMTFNSDTTSSNYAYHLLYGDGSSVYSTGSANASANTFAIPGGNAATNAFGGAIVDVTDFQGSKNKTIRGLSGYATSASRMNLFSGLWKNTAALTSLTVTVESSRSFITGSRFSLYGIKG